MTTSSSSVGPPGLFGERVLDANRTIGQPDSLRLIFGRCIQKRCGRKLQTVIEDMHSATP